MVFFFPHFSYVFIFTFACTESLLINAGFSHMESGGYASLWFMGFLLQWLFLLWNTDSRQTASVVVARGL